MECFSRAGRVGIDVLRFGRPVASSMRAGRATAVGGGETVCNADSARAGDCRDRRGRRALDARVYRCGMRRTLQCGGTGLRTGLYHCRSRWRAFSHAPRHAAHRGRSRNARGSACAGLGFPRRAVLRGSAARHTASRSGSRLRHGPGAIARAALKCRHRCSAKRACGCARDRNRQLHDGPTGGAAARSTWRGRDKSRAADR